jgi:hypothetical protein
MTRTPEKMGVALYAEKRIGSHCHQKASQLGLAQRTPACE